MKIAYACIVSVGVAFGVVAGCGDSASILPGAPAPAPTTPDGDASVSASCAADQTRCSGRCVNATNDPTNCGACGTTCTDDTGKLCGNGVCSVSCPRGQLVCGDRCVDPNTDRAHCGATQGCGTSGGAAGTACESGLVCAAGSCRLSCPAGLVKCADKCVDPQTDPNFCGASGSCEGEAGAGGVRCAAGTNAVGVCSAGACLTACSTGFSDCTSGAGCETNILSDDANCGACATPCAAGTACGGSTCLGRPRSLLPPFTATVTTTRPTVNWVPGAMNDGSRVQFCRDRACANVIEAVDVAGTVASAKPANPLPAGLVWWRVLPKQDTKVAGTGSATWYFMVPTRDTPVDSFYGWRMDYNGDGISDLSISARNANRAYVYFGSPTGIAAVPNQTLTNPTGVSCFGYGNNAGDVNGDGYSDLFVGSCSAVGMIYLGGPTGVSTTPLRTYNLPSGGEVGYRVAALGDVNGDGYGDVMVGGNSGRAWLLYGEANGPTQARIVTFTGGLGYRVGSAGDVNGDRLNDYAIGDGNSAARFFLGKTTDALPTDGTAITGFGNPAGAADLNGDGYTDLSVTAIFGSNTTVVFNGSATGLNLATPSMTLPVRGNGNNGYAVVAIPDSNGDGYGDLAFGPYNGNPSQVLIHQGSATGVTAAATLTIQPPMGSSSFGRTLVSPGDLNNDGFPDLVMGTDNERAYVFHGSATGYPAVPTLMLTAPANGQFSYAW